MSLTPEQKQTVTEWVVAGDNLSAVQKKIFEQFKVSMTYMDVRFLVDDLELTLKDAAPKADTSDISRIPAPAATAPAPADEVPAGDDEAVPDATEGGQVTVTVDQVTLNSDALASGDVTFSDGVTGKWIVDQSGRPGLTQISQPGYRPNPADAQVFMQELGRVLQSRGM